MKKTAEITSIRPRLHSNRERYLPSGCVVHVDCNATNLIDSFFSENEIYLLGFKCKTWGKVSRLGTKATIVSLREIFGDDTSIKWSRTAGCACGCSPGYRVGNLPYGSPYTNKNMSVKVVTDVSAIKGALPGFKIDLDKEIAKNS
jgi:hypothetical protein